MLTEGDREECLALNTLEVLNEDQVEVRKATRKKCEGPIGGSAGSHKTNEVMVQNGIFNFQLWHP